MAPKRKRRKQAAMPVVVPVPQLGPERYLNRELSWLQFNRRVLSIALDPRHPLLERVRSLSVFSSNMDEFFMVRVSGIRAQIEAGVLFCSSDGRTPAEQLAAIKPAVEALIVQQRRCLYEELLPQLAAQGIVIHDYADLSTAQRQVAEEIFEREIFPVLTPLAFDSGHPFPHISNLSLNLAVIIRDRRGVEHFARVKLPGLLSRLMPIPSAPGEPQIFVWLEQLIAANLQSLFPGMIVEGSYPFKVTRNADIDLRESEAADLLRTIEHGIRQRQFEPVIRLAVDTTMPARILDLLVDNFEIGPDDIYHQSGPIGLYGLMELYRLDRPDLKYPPFVAPLPELLRDTEDVFAAIQAHDILLHHPYDSFLPVVDFIRKAAEDPQVLAIKQTLYRVGRDSPIVEALVQAREKGKQVTVLVELKARFDEENNIEWARRLEQAGVHVVYGLLGLKTHCKVALVVRKERDKLSRYVHLATGNYNVTTALQYTDVGLLTCRPEIGEDVSNLFNYLTGYSNQRAYRCLSVAPVNLRETLLKLIEREVNVARKGNQAHLIFKCNSLTDPTIIEALYAASQVGVRIDLIIREVCCLRPGVPGLSEKISVRSLMGRFVEHSRIFYFRNGGNEEVYIGSADLMSRNMERRVEVLFPLEERRFVRRIYKVLALNLEDTVNTHLLQADGSYIRVDGAAIDSQASLLRQVPSVGDRMLSLVQR